MTATQHPDVLRNLVLFTIGLAILAALVALAWYFGVELPVRSALNQAPLNTCHPCPCDHWIEICVKGCCRVPGA